MIRGYTDFAANERTFLAWVRTAIAVIALGFVIERFNLFLLVMVPQLEATGGASQLHGLVKPSGQYGGMALVGAGVVLIIVAMVWFFFRLFGCYRKILRICRAKQARRCFCFLL